MPKPGKQAAETKERPRLTDYVTVGGASLDGERIERDEILGEDILVTDFVFVPSTKYDEERKEGDRKSEFVVIQFQREGSGDKLFTTSTGAGVVVDTLKEQPKNYLPVWIKLVWKKSGKGRRYLSIE